jgi:PAS domain S-box-containing protein
LTIDQQQSIRIDDTALRQSEERAARSEEQLQLITNIVPAYIAYIDRDFRYVRVNRTYEIAFGRQYDDIAGMPVAEVLGKSFENIRCPLEKAMRGEEQHFETRMRTVQAERILSVSHIPDFDESGHVRGVVIYGHDITERRAFEQELRDNQERLHAAQQVASVASWQWDAATQEIHWNEGSARVYGRPFTELKTTAQFFQFVHEEDRQLVRDAIQKVYEGEVHFKIEFRVLWPDGSVHWLSSSGQVEHSPEGKPLKLVGVNLDITDRKRSEMALVQTEKLAAVGRLAASIAHEINNPLESVTNLIYLASLNPNLDRQTHAYLEMADAELRRVSSITAQTLRFHRQTVKPVATDIAELLNLVLTLHAHRFTHPGVKIETDGLRKAVVRCKEGDIRQVLNNLISNALDALVPPAPYPVATEGADSSPDLLSPDPLSPDPSEPDLFAPAITAAPSLRGAPGTAGRLLLRSRRATDWKTGRSGVRVTVADNGEGMSAATQARAFDAFYTTKGPDGNGLGLWVSIGIIKNHGGQIHIRSRQGAEHHGTVFALFLPDSGPIN